MTDPFLQSQQIDIDIRNSGAENPPDHAPTPIDRRKMARHAAVITPTPFVLRRQKGELARLWESVH